MAVPEDSRCNWDPRPGHAETRPAIRGQGFGEKRLEEAGIYTSVQGGLMISPHGCLSLFSKTCHGSRVQVLMKTPLLRLQGLLD